MMDISDSKERDQKAQKRYLEELTTRKRTHNISQHH